VSDTVPLSTPRLVRHHSLQHLPELTQKLEQTLRIDSRGRLHAACTRGRSPKAVALHANAWATNETPEVLNSGIETTLIGHTKHFGGGIHTTLTSSANDRLITTLTGSENDKLILACTAVRFMQYITAGENIDATLTRSGNDKLIIAIHSMQSFTAGEGIGATLTRLHTAIRLMQHITAGGGIDTTLTSSEIDKLIRASLAIRFMPNITAAEGIDTTLTSSGDGELILDTQGFTAGGGNSMTLAWTGIGIRFMQSSAGGGVDTTLKSETARLIWYLTWIAIRFTQNIAAGQGTDTTLTSEVDKLVTVRFMPSITTRGGIDTTLTSGIDRLIRGASRILNRRCCRGWEGGRCPSCGYGPIQA
jgi:hypothetical protein